VCVLVLASCDDVGDVSAVHVSGLPGVNTHNSRMTFERADGSTWIIALPRRSPGENQPLVEHYRLPRGAVHAERFEIEGADPTMYVGYPMRRGPHHEAAVLHDHANHRLLIYDDESERFVDRAPIPTGVGEAWGEFLLEASPGELFYLFGGIQRSEPTTDRWEIIDEEAALRVATIWNGKIIAANATSVGEVTAAGFTPIATCDDPGRCAGVNWNTMLHPSSGKLWLSENWRFFEFDGSRFRPLGVMPNPDTEYITQTMGTVVNGTRIFSMNRRDYNTSYARLLSWEPGGSTYVHEIMSESTIKGSHATNVVFPGNQRDGMGILLD
jgi:hypothetical protein